MTRTAIRVIIADDHPVIAEGVTNCLAQQHDIAVVGQVISFAKLLEFLQHSIADVVVLDIQGMGAGPYTMVRQLRRDYPRMAIVVFSSTYTPAPELVAAGIHGYLMKEELTSLLVQAIQGAGRHEVTFSPSVTDYLNRSEFVKSHTNMTEREHEVIRLLAKGQRTEEIASQLSIHPRTAQNHIMTLHRKTGCLQRSELIAWYRTALEREPSEAC